MRLRSWLIFWAVSIAAFCLTFMVFFVNPIVAGYSKSKIESMTVNAVNNAIAKVMTIGIYRELTFIHYDTQGKISGLSVNMVQMNRLSGDIALTSQGFMETFAQAGLGVPVGTFSGLPVLTGRGPNVTLKVVPAGAVYCTFDSEFVGQGINQTVHRIMLHVNTTVNLIMPLGSRNIKAEIQVLLCDSIIVGEVPEFFFSR